MCMQHVELKVKDGWKEIYKTSSQIQYMSAHTL